MSTQQPIQAPIPLCLWTHDPSGQPMDYSAPFPAPATATVTGVTVTPVDANDVPLVSGFPTISNISWALIATPTGMAWYVTFWLVGGVAGTLYNLRIRWTLSDTRGSDRTVGLLCANT